MAPIITPKENKFKAPSTITIKSYEITFIYTYLKTFKQF